MKFTRNLNKAMGTSLLLVSLSLLCVCSLRIMAQTRDSKMTSSVTKKPNSAVASKAIAPPMPVIKQPGHTDALDVVPSSEKEKREREEMIQLLEEGLSFGGELVKINPDDVSELSLVPQQMKFVKSDLVSKAIVKEVFPFKDLVYGNMKDVGLAKDGETRNFVPEIGTTMFSKSASQEMKHSFVSLTRGYNYPIFNPIISPNGNDIVFLTGDPGSTMEPFGLHHFNTVTKKVKKVVDAYVRKREVALSPDGRYVAYVVGERKLTLQTTNLMTGDTKQVVQGDTLGFFSWLSNNEVVYSINKKHTAGEKIAYFPVLFVLDVATRKYRVLIDGGQIVSISPSNQFAIYGGIRNQSKKYSEENYVVRFRNLVSKQTKEIKRLPNNRYVPVTEVVWNSKSNKSYWMSSEIDEGAEKSATLGVKENVPFIMIHDVYEFDTETQGFKKVAHFKSRNLQIETEAKIFSISPSGQMLYIGVKEANEKATPNNPYQDVKYTIKSFDLKNRKWKNITTLKGVMGITGLTQDGKQTSLVSY